MTGAIPWFPESASEHAQQVDLLFLGLLTVSALIVLLLLFLIVFSVIRYRSGSGADRSPIRLKTIRIEIFWTSLTTLAFLGLFIWGAALYLDIGEDDPEAERVYVIGRQWMWDVHYPSGRRDHNRLVVPVGHPVRLVMTSEDVIHSFYMPALRVKHDVVPGRYVSISFTANRPGIYPIYCAEFCGTKHSAMTGELVILNDSDYQRWLVSGSPIPSMASHGRKLFSTQGCAGCHMPGAAVRAPPLDGIFGKQIALSDGSFVIADEQYIHDSILLPMKHVVAGFPPVMPTYRNQLSETEVLALVEYLKSRRSETTTTIPASERPVTETLRKETPEP